MSDPPPDAARSEEGAPRDGGLGPLFAALTVAAGIALAVFTILQLREAAVALSTRLSEELVHDRLGGNIVDHAVRVHRGEPLYVAPDDRWVPVVYTPLYYGFAAGVMAVVGEGVFACRLAAALLVGAGALVALALVRRMTGSWSWAALGVPIVTAGYALCDFFYDAPRVDPMSSLLVVLATWAAVRGTGTKSAVMLGGLCVAAYFAKQSTLAFSVVLLGGLLVVSWRRALVAGAVAAALGGALLAVANGASDGWFWRYCVYLTTQHDFPPDRVRAILAEDLRAVAFPLVGLVALVPFLLAAKPRAEATRPTALLVLAALGTVAFSFTSHARSGATIKVLMPLGLVFAAALPAGFAWLARRRETLAWRWGVRWVAILLVGGFAVQHRFVAADAVTAQEDLARWEELHADVLARCDDGQVWVAPWGYFTTPIEGQGMRPNLIALEDYLGVKGNDTGLPFPEALREMIENERFVAIYMPMKGGNRDLRSLVKEHYRAVERREMVVGTNRFTMDLGTFVPIGEAGPGRRR